MASQLQNGGLHMIEIEFNGYNFEVVVRDVHEGGLFKSS